MILTAISASGHNRGHNGAVILNVSFRLYFLLDALRQIDDLLQIIARLIDYLVQFIPPEASDKIEKYRHFYLFISSSFKATVLTSTDSFTATSSS